MGHTKQTPNRLKELRALNRYTIEEIASLVGVSIRQVLKWEDGLAIPLSKNLLRLCVLYNTTPEKIYPELYTYLSSK